MHNAIITTSGEWVITPSQQSSANDFDFLMGTHNVHHKKLIARLTDSNDWVEFDGTHSMEALLNGIGNLERQFMKAMDGKPIEGIALRLFNPATRLWSIYWADSRSGTLDVPVVGSFENKVGFFYAKDTFEGRPILLQFKWDATHPDLPVWSQAFSADNGKTWEWNWYMYFSKTQGKGTNQFSAALNAQPIGVIELRNYLIRQGKREQFINYFEENLIQPQRELKGYPLGQYRVKGTEDHFCWIRGFESLQTRSAFLPLFYYGPVWKQHRSAANAMLANNDHVHLLRPVVWQKDALVPVETVNSSLLVPQKGIAVVDFFTANTKLSQLMKLFATSYLPVLHECEVRDYTLWISVLAENDFPQLPVFQDKNLLVSITFFDDESDYVSKMKKVDSKIDESLKAELQDVITVKHTLVLYPTQGTVNA